MFTGIIEKTGKLLRIERTDEASAHILVETGFTDLEIGESVANDGVCLTVTEIGARGEARFFISPETMRCTRFTTLSEGQELNLERALRAGDRLSGHFVQGHVDGIAGVERLRPQGQALELEIRLPENLSRYCAPKGSIALNGVSLTINAREASLVRIMLIPQTLAATNLKNLKEGESVNVEADVLAKYVAHQSEYLCRT